VSFDVIVVDYESHEELRACLAGLVRWESDNLGRVVVVDNSPAPAPQDLARFPLVTWVRNRENVGFSRAVNQVFGTTRSPFVCLLNPDTVLSGPFWKALETWFCQNPKVGIVGPKIVDEDGSVQGSARAFPTLATAFFGRTSLFSRLFPANPLTRKNILTEQAGSSPSDVDWVSGACMFVRRAAAEQVGPMDERFFLYWEDCDWCTRFRRAGWRIVYHPGAGPVTHLGGRASRHSRRMALYHFHRSATLLYWKYDRSPGRIGSLAALLGAALRFGILSLKAETRQKAQYHSGHSKK
jgi:GT2 family glycosyltransferase